MAHRYTVEWQKRQETNISGQSLLARIDFFIFLLPMSVQTFQLDMAIRMKIKHKYLFTFSLTTLEGKVCSLGLIFIYFCY